METKTDPMGPVWVSIRVLLLGVAAAMLHFGVDATSPIYKDVLLAAGAVTFICPAVWGVWVAVTDAVRKRRAQVRAVQAGINLVVAGQALTNQGALIQVANPDTTPPLAVTEKTAPEIVKNFAPATVAN